MPDIKDVLARLDLLPEDSRAEILSLINALDSSQRRDKAKNSYLDYVRFMWDDFIFGSHHKIIAEAFDEIVTGKNDRLIICLPPRHTKSEFASIYLPSYFLGRYPNKKIIQASHTSELAVGYGRKVRALVSRPEYQEIFPGVRLSADSKAAGRWSTNKGGEYFAIGVGGAVAGKGADLFVIDDAHPLVLGTEIPTPKGFVKIEDLVVGNEVYGPDGLPVKVVAKSPVYERPIYRVETSDGQAVDCGGSHLWPYMSDTNVAKAKIKIATAAELAAWNKPNKPILPRVSPVQYPSAELPIDPWVLGAWLGDGTSSLGRMTAHPEDRPYMVGEFEKAGYQTTELADEFSFGVLGLRRQLIDLGVLNNKHVPQAYMTASIGQRMSLLQGLMDTDGNVTHAGQCVFHNTSIVLAQSVVEILHSLGVRATLRQYQDKRSAGERVGFGKAKPMFRVTFKLNGAARMPRKAERTFTPTDKRGRSFTVVETGNTGAMQCITVDRKDGLFLCGRGYVVTHNSEQDQIIGESNPAVYDRTMEWYEGGPRQRLQPGGAIVIVMTRWSKRDLVGQLLKKQIQEPGGDQWKVIEFPAILPSGNPVWPEYWTLDRLIATKNSIPISKWNAQYQQDPTAEEGALIKREHWRDWEQEAPPKNIELVIQSWDTALSSGTRANYSACTTWGIFKDENGEKNGVILLDAIRGKWEFPDLKEKALEHYKVWKPDICLIEARAAGAPLVYELRRMGIPVQDIAAGRGGRFAPNDKISRVNSVTDMFASGNVWAPKGKTWAQEVIEECAAFPAGENDDYVDTVVMALQRFRVGGWVANRNDEMDSQGQRRRAKTYY